MPAVLRPVLDTLLAAVEEVKTGAIVTVYQVGTLEERIAALEQAPVPDDPRRAG